MGTFSELTEVLLDVVLKALRLIVLEDFNIQAEATLPGLVQDFIASLTALGFSQILTGPTHERDYTSDLIICNKP